jgi:hypothetical protein
MEFLFRLTQCKVVLRQYYYTSSRGDGDKWHHKNKTGAAGAPETGLMILSPLQQALGS